MLLFSLSGFPVYSNPVWVTLECDEPKVLKTLKSVTEYLFYQVSADTTKKRINSLTMELMEARNTLDAKKKVSLPYADFLCYSVKSN